ncbi:MAG: GAF domain-containing protein, partial [Anaerolineales bacterium]
MSPEPRLDADTHAENEKLRELLQAREAELSVLNSIQEALMAGEDIDSIFEIAGEQISKIFPGEGVALYTYDPETHIGEAKYILEDGERHYPPPFKAGAIGRKAASTKQTLVLNTRQEFKDIGAVTVEGTKPSLSGIYAPMLVNERPVGAFNVESTQREHAFDDADVQLVNSIARSLSIALENARLFNKTQQLLEETEARNAELAIINIVQSALASKLDIQAIYDIVGDKLQEVFSDAQVVDILTYDPATQLFHPRFVIERGKRYEVEPWIARGFRKHVINTGEPLVINSDMEAMAKEYDNNWVVLGEFAKSFVGVPMMIGSVPSGVISLQHLDEEYAFSESDVRLIQTLAGSMSVALENARLFKETEERNAELAIINTVQQALASELDIQGIYDAVGEKLRTIFDSQIVAIYSTDIEARIQTCVYAFEKGRRLEVVSQSIGSLHDYLLEVDDTMVFNSNFEEFAAQFEDYQVSQGEMPRSVAIVPVPRMKDPNTYVSLTLQDVDGEKEFTDSDVRLLETLASSMGVALENARLFNETQRLLKETEQRAAELTTINMVGKALVAEPDLDALFELIGEQMRIIFDADIVYVAMLDPDTKIIHFPYTYGEDFEPLELGQGLTSKVIDSGKPLLINTDMDKRRQELGVTRVGKQAASYLGVPIRMGDRAVGVISVQNTSDEEAFCEDDMRLLNTIAANVSAAIRNAQLFAEITHQKQYYEAVIENSPAAIILLDLEANVTGWNPAAERLFGY